MCKEILNLSPLAIYLRIQEIRKSWSKSEEIRRKNQAGAFRQQLLEREFRVRDLAEAANPHNY